MRPLRPEGRRGRAHRVSGGRVRWASNGPRASRPHAPPPTPPPQGGGGGAGGGGGGGGGGGPFLPGGALFAPPRGPPPPPPVYLSFVGAGFWVVGGLRGGAL